MSSIAELKKQILLKKNIKNDPIGAISQLGGKYDEFLEKTIEKKIEELVEEQVKNFIMNEGFLQEMITCAAELIMGNVHIPKKGEDYFDGNDGYTPKKGVDYFTEREIVQLKKSIIPVKGRDYRDGENGKTPKKGVDYFTDKEIETLIKKIKVLAKPMAGVDYKVPEKGKDGTEIEGKEIVTKINALEITPDKQIDAKHIKNLPKNLGGKESTPLFRGGLKLAWNVQLEGAVNGVNTVFTVPSSQPDPKDDRYIVSARGVLKTVDGGDFTVSNNNRTITFTSAPPDGSDAPRIILYHAK